MAAKSDFSDEDDWVDVGLEDALPGLKSCNPAIGAGDLNANLRRAGYEGYLERQSSILKRWKVEWIKVTTGDHLSLHAEPLSNDPKSKDFLGFRINQDNGKMQGQFRASDIFEMRRFMVALGSEAKGLFSKESAGAPLVEETRGLWDIVHPSEDELSQRQSVFDSRKNSMVLEEVEHPRDAPPSYATAVEQLSLSFYFHKDTGVALEMPADRLPERVFPGSAMPAYQPDIPPPKTARRPQDDTFRPPRGPPIFLPVSIGYGPEVGLQPGLQALWDPNQKAYFFLDHINKVTFFEDPRPVPERPPTVPKQSYAYGDRRQEVCIPPGVCADRIVIEATSSRALSRARGFTLDACGRRGLDGANGVVGETGGVGFSGGHGVFSGSHGTSGGPGLPGGPGSDGEKGLDGTNASNIVLQLSGDSEQLYLSGACNLTARLGGAKAEEILLVNCRGGSGGRGGRGGQGGTGGVGGRGGDGQSGSNGSSSSCGNGTDGGDGGDGGVGGSGGPGGPGGRGGNGGHAGSGGVCVLQAVDPTLLMLVDADCRSGDPGVRGRGGKGGMGGEGGAGGSGGSGGWGGSGGSYTDSNGVTHYYSSGSSGFSGRNGSAGIPGSEGLAGQSGVDGRPADCGAILWVVNNSDGGVLYQAATRYDAEVTHVRVTSAIDDGIFEPNERVLVSEVTVLNSGGLPLPEGASIFMPSTKTINFERTCHNLPSEHMYPGQTYTVPCTFYGRVFDQPPPNAPGPFVSTARFHPRVELLGRPFERSFLPQELVVQYPVKLAYLRCPESCNRGEVTTLEVGVQNISRMPYGSCDDSGGTVVVQLHMDARLLPIGSANIGLVDFPYTITYDPDVQDSMFVQLHEIPPNQIINIAVTVQIESRAELFDRCHWQADLYLRDKLIEYNFERIRVVPIYLPQDPSADILMVTSRSITRKDFVFWQHILEILNVSVDFWDVTRHKGLSIDSVTNEDHKVTWKGRYSGRMILYPHCDLDLLYSTDILRHFYGDNAPVERHSSMLLFLPDSPGRKQESDSFGDRGVLRHLLQASATIQTQNYGGNHFFGTSEEDKPHLKWEKKHLKKLEKECLMHGVAVLNREVHIEAKGVLGYSYGSVDIRRVPLLRSAKFLAVDGAGGSVVHMNQDDAYLSPATCEIPLASNFGQVFLSVLHCLPMSCKIRLLKGGREKLSQKDTSTLTFLLPNGSSLGLPELVMITASSEIADELYNCSGKAERMQLLAGSIELETDAFLANGCTILQGFELLKKELKERKTKVGTASITSATKKEIKRHITMVKKMFHDAGVSDSKLGNLIPLEYLLSQQHMHRSHQHWINDSKERWNLASN